MTRHSGSKVAVPALLGAISLIVLYGASIFPTGVWGLVALAGLAPCAAVASIGLPAGFLCWGGTSVLALLLLPDKFCALLFTVLFGVYPMVKALAERAKRVLSWLLKLIFFNAAFTLLFLLMKTLLLASLPGALSGYGIPLLYLVVNAVFCIYDFGLTKLICLYITRIDKAVRKSARH